MRHFHLCLILFGFGFITLTNHQCLYGSQNGIIFNNGSCASYSDSILNSTLTCSGISLSNVNDFKGFTDAAFDLYTLLRSKLDASEVASFINRVRNGNQTTASLSDANFARLWFQLKLSPYVSSLSKETLSCLSQSSLTCQSFQALVKELDKLIGPERKKMVYQNFIKPFLTRTAANACANNVTDQEWLTLNFQTFSSIAPLVDFETLKSNFTGVAVINQLTPEQRAELMFNLLESGALHNGTVNQLLQSFQHSLLGMTVNITGGNSNLTDLLALLKPMGRFIRTSITIITNKPNITSNVKKLLNWMLISLPLNASLSVENITRDFNSSNIDDWVKYVVTPVVQKYSNQTSNITSEIARIVFATDPQPADPVEICRVTSNNSSCPITQTAESVANLIKCVASSNLNITEGNLQLLITALTNQLRTFANQSTANSSSAQNNLTALFGELPAESLTSGNLADVEYTKFWFQTKMIPLLPTVNREFLSCLSGRDFSCQAYREIIAGLNNNAGLMGSPTQRLVYTNFIHRFLSRRQNTSVDCTLPFTNSTDFIQQNFGSFSSLATLQEFYDLKSNFSALDALNILSPEQLNELMIKPRAKEGDRNEILRRVFDFLLQASNRDKLNHLLPSFQTQARTANFSCENYRNIFDRVDQTLSPLLPNQTEALLTYRDSLMMIPPDECIDRSGQCASTPVNETAICADVNSTALDQFLNTPVNATGSQTLCNFSVSQFACLPTVSRLTPQQVADMLACKLSSNVTKETWKLFFTRVITRLDEALLRFSNTTPSPSNVFLSDVLDVIVEVRINRLSPQRLRDAAFIGTWFQGRLKPFLASLSQRSLSCLSTKNLTCESYRRIFVELNNKTGLMGNSSPSPVYTNFIRPFLSQRQNSGVDCTLPFTNSTDFIQQNFGSFSSSATLQEFYDLKSNFSALDALNVLSREQLNDLVFTPHARAGDRNEILRRVFDFLLLAPNRDKLNEFLPSLQTQARRANFSCENYRNIFDRVDQTLSPLLPNQTEALLTYRDSLMMIPPDECIDRSGQCASTPVNETAICADVNSTALDQFLNTPVNATGSQTLCNFSVSQFACLPTVSRLTPQQVADMLACKLSSNVTKETWKLFFTRVITQLDEALLRFSNTTPSPSNVFLSDVLDVIVEVRINRLSPQRLRDAAFIGTWFQGRLKPFLASLSQRSLSCLSTKNLTCESYRRIFVELNNKTGLMGNSSPSPVYTNFIRPFLSQRQNSGVDCTLPFTNSTDFIQQNFGSFSSSATLQEFYDLKSNFSALDALNVLSREQLNDLVFTPHARAGDRNEILRRVFDFLLLAPNRDKLNEFLPSLQTQARRANFSCENYRNIFDRVDQTLSPLLPNQTEALLTYRDSLMMIPPDECIDRSGQCASTPVNETAICADVNSTALDQFLNTPVNATGSQTLCNFSVSQFACLPTVSRLTPQQLADMLACKLSSNVTKETWKLFFTRVITQLDEALLRFSNTTPSPSNVFLSDVLDVIVEVRINRLSPQRLRDAAFIGTWFQGRLKPFLASLSQRSLSCLSTKNLTCESYRRIFVELNNKTGLMGNSSPSPVYTNFIRPFLSQRQNSGVDCTLPFTNSTDFIQQNFGSFSSSATLQEFYDLKSNFSALDALNVLSREQLNDLVFTPHARAGDRNEILRRVFDFLLLAPNRDKLNEFLPSLQTQARRANFSCENYRNIFDRVDQTLSPLLPNQTEALLTYRDSLMMIPPDECIDRSGQCASTPVNETAICADVNSTALDQFLNTPVNATGSQTLCNFSVSQFACLPTVSRLTPQQLADMLACKLSSNVTKETWKLFFTRVITRLDEALLRFSNTTPSPSNVFLSDVLDVIVEVRINRLSPQRLRDAAFIGTWFQGRLKPFLASLSQRSLSCLSTKNLTCESYRRIFVELNNKTGLMGNSSPSLVYTNFIRPFLSQRQNSGVDCTLPFTNSTDFIQQNFGSFSSSATLQEFYDLKSNFSALDALNVLSREQLNDLVFTPHARAGDRNEILRRVFDFLLLAPNRDKLNEFLPSLQTQARRANFSCENYRNIFDRVDQTLSPLLPNQTEALLTYRDSLMMIPPDECIDRSGQCASTPVNETAICADVNSTALDQFLNTPVNATGSQTLCNFSVSQFACLPTVSRLTPQQVADMLACKLSSNVTKETWKLFFTRVITQLDEALLRFSNTTPSPSNVFLSDVLDVIVEVRINRLSPQRLRDAAFIGTWFQGRLKPFLASLSQRSLSCLSTKNLTCESYRRIFVELNNKTGLMGNSSPSLVYTNFIRPFLSQRQNSGVDCTLPFTNSTDFIQQNFGSFSSSATLQEFYDLKSNFSALDALNVLSREQLNDLVFTPHARAGDRNEILRRVFDFLLLAPNRDKLNEFLPSLQTQARRANFSCENYRNIFDRVDQTLSPLLPNQTEALLTYRDSLMMIPPDECIDRSGQCASTPVNETAICADVNSTALDQFLNTPVNATGSQTLCNFSVSQFACLPTVSRLTPQQVADMLACKLSSNVTKETWKLFFTRVITQLDEALLRFSNTTPSPSNVFLSDVLDVIVEVRINRLSPQRLRDAAFIGTWFQGRLKPFLASLSQRSLSCLSTKNLTCESYRRIFVELNNKTGLMGNSSPSLVYTNFIRPFLSQRQNSGVDCTLPFTNSTDFIQQNFGSFSSSATLQEFYDLKSNFSALDALNVLSREQLNDLVFTPHARAGDRNEILRRVFDFLLLAPNRDKLNEFLPSLQTQARRANFSCENYRNIFDRVDQTLSPLLPNQTEALLTYRDSLMMIPPDECIDRSGQCASTPVNETAICADVNSTALDQFLNTPVNATGSQTLCNFSVSQFACLPTVSRLTPQQVADMLACKLSSNVTKETWKLFFTRVITQLDEALLRFSNTTPSPSNVFLSDVLDVIVEVRINRLSPQRLRDAAFIGTWFQGRLKPFLASLSQRSLSCLSTKNLTCESYRRIFVELNNKTGLMGNSSPSLVYTNFIRPFLSQRQNSGVDCTLPFTNSTDFIQQNFGSFSSSATLQEFYDLKSNFSALDALNVLSREQLNDLVFTPHARAGDRNEILRRVFDFLLLAPNRDKLNEFLPSLQTQARRANFSCENYRNIFDRVDQTLSPLLPNQTEALLTYRDSLMMIPPDECIDRSGQCASTPVNETAICADVNSTALDQFLNTPVNATGSQTLCNFSVSQFACLPTVSRLTPQQVADMLACKLSSNVTKETWKLFFTRVITQLDEALLRFSNTTPSPSNVVLSDVLDVIVEVRINRLSPQRLRDAAFIGTWFQGRLKPFLASLSQRSLSCLSTKNLTCESYRRIFVELNNKTGLMGNSSPSLVYTNFIRPFLSQRQNSGVDCTLPFTNSTDFIQQNFGSFSSSATLQEFYDLKSNFSALDALNVLSREQLNDLVFTPHARAGDRNEILRRVFDFLLLAPNRDKLNEFLPSLQTQARRANFSCENYRNIFDRVDQTLSPLLPNQTEALLTYRDSLMMIPPDECIDRSGQCASTPVNETAICADVNSTALDQFLNTPVNATGSQTLCNFSVSQFACLPTVSRLTPQQVADMLACKLSSNVTKETWKLFFTRVITRLDEALLRFSNTTPSPSNVFLSDVLDVIVEVRINRLSPQRLRDAAFIGTWFQGRLKPFLASLSQRSLSCLSTKNLTCESYRRIVEAFVNAVPQDGQDVCKPLQPTPVTQRRDLIYTEFIHAFLSRNNTDDPRCLRDTANSTQWLVRNLGVFSQSAPLKTLQTLNRNFTGMEILPLLSFKQLLEFSATPGSLMDPPGVNNVMKYVKDCQLGAFFDSLSPGVQDVPLTQDVKAALIRQIFDRANLSNANTSNEEFVTWINSRIKPLLTNLTDSLVTPFFDILSTRDCNITQNTVKLLDGVRPSMPNNTKNAIYNNILKSIRGPQPLRCYRNNSFITFVNESLLGFGPPPNVTTLLSLVPPPRKIEIVNSIPPSELGSYLTQPDVVDSDAEICFIFKNMGKTPEFLENIEVPDPVKRSILPCVWPLALSSDNQTEIDLWFDRRLKVYLKFLNTAVLGSNDTLNAPCLSYRKMVNVLGSKSFNASQLSSADIYNTTIKTYLKTDSNPKCFNVTDTRFNSTAWFVNFIGVNFISFMSIDDLYSFGPESTIKTFSVDPANIQLFNQPGIQKKVLSRYTELIFLQNPSFNLFSLPSTLQCDAPVSVFTKLNESQTDIILGNFKTSCSGVDPQISAVLVGNIKTIDASAIQNLGQESVGLTTVQINKAPLSVLISGLSTLGNVTGWSFGQAQAIVTVLLSGNFQLNSTSLLSLGSLIGGLPSENLVTIAPQQILETSRDPVFVKNILAAPEIVQMTFVNQLIKVNTSVSALMSNVPNEMALQIPRNLLIIPATEDVAVLKQFNDKKWKPEQAVLFFDSVAGAFNNSDDLSVDVLQGFTCTRVQKFTKAKTKGLINACRKRPGRTNVKLSESQLTCMYNLIRDDLPLDFDNYPKDMLLYYNYETIPKSSCTSYFTEVGSADFSVLSSELQGKRGTLWSNAQGCLNIDGNSIKKKDLAVLGNLACVLDKDNIENSDPDILENMKNCKDLSNAQMGAMETVLLKGTSKYGPPGKWNQKTLDDLGILPLYFSKSFWGSFKQNDLNKFLKSFLKSLRTNKTPKVLIKKLFGALIVATPLANRAGDTCTKGNITSIEISGDDFPFGYDATQFKACLSADVVRDNLASLCEKIDDDTFQRVILDKLKEISPSGLSESQVKVLGPVSRVATTDEINKWNITKSDTLAALMNSNEGSWNSSQTKEIITKYLSANNSLAATELNIVKGPNLCSLNTSTLKTISSESIKGADTLDVSKCSSDDKKVFFSLANTAFPIASASGQSTTLAAYQLVESYLGGADVTYIRNLTSLSVSMSLPTFIKLDGGVVTNLTVSEVVGLLGSNLRDLKTYENQTLVRSWISLQLQSDLDRLNITLTGGKSNATSPNNSTLTTTTVMSPSTTVKTNAGASGIRANEWSFSFTILLLIFTIIKVDL